MWNLTLRRAQEAVELALKGALWWAGLEVPRIHDVGVVLRQNRHRFPPEFAAHIPKLASISRALAAERERSFYGDEELSLPRKCSTRRTTLRKPCTRRPSFWTFAVN
ncbi:MAG: HEPN domain-containing protein [Anaerolineales bacterium]